MTSENVDPNSKLPIPELGQRIALVAGNGQYPLDFAKKVRSMGKELVVIAVDGETNPAIAEFSQSPLHWVKVGQFSKLLDILKKSNVKQVTFAGGVSRVKLFRNFLPDLKAFTLAAKLGTIKDDVLLRAIADEIEALGMQVINGALYLEDAIPKFGLLSSRPLNDEEMADALTGWKAAKIVGQYDIGQAVIVYKSLVVAVEAVEGTDEVIARSGSLTNLAGGSKKHSGAVMVKVCKPQQDKRLDLPTFGPKTIVQMRNAGVTAAVIEAGASLLLDPQTVVELANKNDIALFAARSESDLVVEPKGVRDFSIS